MSEFQYKFKDGKFFTGMHDISGTEIYDGDRVVVSSDWKGISDVLGTVRFLPNRAIFVVYYDKPPRDEKSHRYGKSIHWGGMDDLRIRVLTA